MDKFENARTKYRPHYIKYLFVAETPPKANSNRFFYFEDVTERDSLFIETMKVLYPKLTYNINVKDIRQMKSKLLLKFQSDGFYLIDSLNKPFEKKYSTSQKIELISLGQSVLLNKIKKLLNVKTKVILITAPVFIANYSFLKNNGINMIQDDFIDFPLYQGKIKFAQKLSRVLNDEYNF